MPVLRQARDEMPEPEPTERPARPAPPFVEADVEAALAAQVDVEARRARDQPALGVAAGTQSQRHGVVNHVAQRALDHAPRDPSGRRAASTTLNHGVSLPARTRVAAQITTTPARGSTSRQNQLSSATPGCPASGWPQGRSAPVARRARRSGTDMAAHLPVAERRPNRSGRAAELRGRRRRQQASVNVVFLRHGRQASPG